MVNFSLMTITDLRYFKMFSRSTFSSDHYLLIQFPLVFGVAKKKMKSIVTTLFAGPPV